MARPSKRREQRKQVSWLADRLTILRCSAFLLRQMCTHYKCLLVRWHVLRLLCWRRFKNSQLPFAVEIENCQYVWLVLQHSFAFLIGCEFVFLGFYFCIFFSREKVILRQECGFFRHVESDRCGDGKTLCCPYRCGCLWNLNAEVVLQEFALFTNRWSIVLKYGLEWYI